MMATGVKDWALEAKPASLCTENDQILTTKTARDVEEKVGTGCKETAQGSGHGQEMRKTWRKCGNALRGWAAENVKGRGKKKLKRKPGIKNPGRKGGWINREGNQTWRGPVRRAKEGMQKNRVLVFKKHNWGRKTNRSK